MPKVTVNGETHEVKLDDIELDEGYKVFGPDSIPDGYFTQDAMEQKIQDRVARAKRNAEESLLEDDSFNKKVLNKYGVLLDDKGKPKGLKPDVDIDEIKTQTAKQVSEDYEKKLSGLQTELEKRNEAVIESAILSATNGVYREDLTKSFDGEKPLVVEKFKSKMGVDESGQPYVKDENGEKVYKGDGVLRPKDYLLDKSKFGELMADKRQRGSGFGGGADTGGRRTWTDEDLRNMSDAEYEKHREEILASAADKR